MTELKIKSLRELLTGIAGASESRLDESWQLRAFVHEDCISYVARNERHHEGLVIDPKLECEEAIAAATKGLSGVLWLAVIDTHTHADHVSCASAMAEKLRCPLIMHAASGTTRAQLRVCRETTLPAHAGPITLLPTPGHTPDGLTAVWGPFAFTGDTVFIDDVGRDDLPGGDPEAHYASLQLLRARLEPESVILPGHDNRGGRAATWAQQLKSNGSLRQEQREFVKEAGEFQAPAPKDFKRSLFENLK